MKSLFTTFALVMSLIASAQTPQLYQDLYPGSSYQYGVSNLYFGVPFNGKIIFNVRDSATAGYKLYAMDGNTANTALVKDITQVANLFTFNNAVYFGFVDASQGAQLWKTDGTASGTQLVTTLGSNAIAPNSFATVNNMLLFRSGNTANPTIQRLYLSDGTAAGTQLLDTGLYYADASYGFLNGKMLFAASTNRDSMQQRELYITDGTRPGTQLLMDINPGVSGSNPAGFTPYNNKLMFYAITASAATELWSTDGTAGGTQMVADLNPGTASGIPFSTTGAAFNGLYYFKGRNANDGNELFVTDGTAAGTALFKDIAAGSASSSPGDFIIVNNKLLFIANDQANGSEVWVSDGTSAGTVLLKDINPGMGSGTYALINTNRYCDHIYFDGDDGNNNIEPWVTDGTVAGTKKLGEINPGTTGVTGSVDYETRYMQLNQRIYFSAFSPATGKELYYLSDTCNTTDTRDIAIGRQFSVFPNPAYETVTLRSSDIGKSIYEVYNMSGVRVLWGAVKEETLVDIRSLTNGIYIVRVSTKEGWTYRKFIKQ